MDVMDEPPVTGNEAVDEALRKVAGLGDQPVTEHPAVLSQAQDALQKFLSSSTDAV